MNKTTKKRELLPEDIALIERLKANGKKRNLKPKSKSKNKDNKPELPADIKDFIDSYKQGDNSSPKVNFNKNKISPIMDNEVNQELSQVKPNNDNDQIDNNSSPEVKSNNDQLNVTINNSSNNIEAELTNDNEPLEDFNDVEVSDYKIWISIALQPNFYADDEGNIPLDWQQLAKKYHLIDICQGTPQLLIDKAIELLDDEDKTSLALILNQDESNNHSDNSSLLPSLNQEVTNLGVNETNTQLVLNKDCPSQDNQLLSDLKLDKQEDLENLPDKDNSKVSDKTQKSYKGKNETYRLVENDEDLLNEIVSLSLEKVLAIDTETTGLDPHLNKLRLIQIASYGQPTVLIDCFKCDPLLIQPLLMNDSIKVFHNAKFDLQFFLALGLEINQKLFDTQLAYQLIHAGKDNLKSSLKVVAKELLNEELNKEERLSDWKTDKLTDSQLEYASKDAQILLPLREKLKEEIISAELGKVAKIEFDCALAVAMMEFNGMLLHLEKWQNILKDTLAKKQELEQKLQQLLPAEENTLFRLDINLDSHKQLLEALHRAGIKCQNTNSKTLKKLLPKHPEIIKPLLEYKKLSKLISSFGDSLTKKINPVTGRLHGSYWQLGSQSGRFTSSHPNLQQIPRNKETRECFIANPNYKLIIADYSQIELRIAAELTNDKTMIEAYNNGEDLHKLTASIILNKPLAEVSKGDRQIAKSANFGLIYGASVNGFRGYAEGNYGISLTEKEAKKIMDNFFKSYRGLNQWHKAVKSQVYRHQLTETRTRSNRRRLLNQPSPQQALNTPVQGLGADMLKLALAKLVPALKGLDCKILATVHDEIILEAKEDIADKVADILSDVMIEAGKEFLVKVPVEAEASIGDNWSDK